MLAVIRACGSYAAVLHRLTPPRTCRAAALSPCYEGVGTGWLEWDHPERMVVWHPLAATGAARHHYGGRAGPQRTHALTVRARFLMLASACHLTAV